MKLSKPTIAAAILALASVTLPTSVHAQDQDPPGIAARVAFLSGPVSLEVQGDDQWSSAPLNYPMVSGDRIYVSPQGHAAVQIGATDLRLWGGTDVTLTNLTDQYEQIGIAAGFMHVRVFAIQPGNVIEVDTPSGAVIIQNPGDYRINVYPDQQSSLVQVNSGFVQITGPGMNQEVDQGQAVQLYGSNPAEIGLVDPLPADGFDSWSYQRDHHIQYSASARYVSHDIPGYDDLDDYGDWTPASDYGPIWFPRSTPYGWQPYTTGHWAYIAPWGYTWVDDAAWGYAPFHYGRWVQWQGRWGWVPGPPQVRPVYAPAFVAFVGGGPGVSLGVSFGGGGVAAWFPLGVAEPFVPWYHCSPAYVRTVNVTNVNITVIHNVTIVNNYNVFINRVSTARTVNEIQVNNITYVNRTHVYAVNASAMTSGARVQQAAIHLNVQQQQALVRAPISVARPPVPPPAHPVVGVRASVSVAPTRPVLMTTRGRVAATPAANTPHFEPKSLPKPAPAAAIRPATHTVVPNVHPAKAPANAARPNPPNNAPRPGQPAVTQPAARPGQPANNARPTAPGNNHPAPEARPVAPESRPSPAAKPAAPEARPSPATRPAPETKPEAPATRPAPEAKPAAPETRPAPATRPAPEARPVPQNRSAPAARPETRPAPQAKPAPPIKPAPQAKPAPPANKQPQKPENKNKKPPKEEQNPPQR